MKNIVIGITDCVKYSNYDRWVQNEPDVEIIKLTCVENNFSDIEKCNGIMLTGGNDIIPRLYNQTEDRAY